MSEKNALGIITHTDSSRRPDYLYRISIKSLIRNKNGEILVVKEAGRNYWDLPGGGMDHNENIKTAITREMKEEVNLSGDFTYTIIAVDDPVYSHLHNFWQVRLIYELWPEHMQFRAGEDGDAVEFIRPDVFKASKSLVEQSIYTYAQQASQKPL